jgi:glycosyltransferase involved in cell wall biosynthesis
MDITKLPQLIPTRPQQLVSIIIPTLNEEEGIEKTIIAIPKNELSKLGFNFEIIIVDGNSTDLTREIAERLGARVVLEKRKGYGRAFKTGFNEAKGDILVTLDADGTYPAELIPDYIQELREKGLEFITINRFSKMQSGAMSFYHKIGNDILSLIMRLLYSIDVKDSQSGMWIMSSNFIQSINIISDDFSMSEEIKIIAFRTFKALELDGRYYKRLGKVKLASFSDGWRNLKYMFRYRSLINDSIRSPVGSLQKEGIGIDAGPYVW